MFDWSELMNWGEYAKLIVGLLAIVDPISAVPIFIGLSAGYDPAQQRQIPLIATITMFAVLVLFTFLGQSILDLFTISMSAFRIAGGLLLLQLAFGMMQTEDETDKTRPTQAKSPVAIAIAPLAIPLLAGPAAISTVVIYSSIHESYSHLFVMVGVIFTLCLFTYLLMHVSSLASKHITPTSLIVFNRLMALIVAAIAIEFILDGLATHFPSLGPIVH